MNQESPKFSQLGFSRSLDLVLASLNSYFPLLGSVMIPLFGIAILLHIPDLVLVFGDSFLRSFPDGLRIFLQVLLGLAGATLAVCFPYFALRILINLRSPQDLIIPGLLKGFDFAEFWRILVIVSMTHVLGLLPLFIPAIMLWLQYFHEVFLWLSIGFLILYVPVWILIIWFLSFTLHHYYFLKEVSWAPLRASYRLIKNRLWAMIQMNLVWLVISLCLGMVFSLFSMVETIFRITSASPSGGFIELMSEVSKMTQSGSFDASMIKQLSDKFSFLQAPSLVGLIESIIKMVLGESLFAFFFLYLLGYYHHSNWLYPRDLFVSKD